MRERRMKQIHLIDIHSPGAYKPFLEGWNISSFMGTPLVLGYGLGGMASGILIADCFDNAITLKWIAVDKRCQGRGIGKRLLESFCTMAAEAGAKRIDAVVCLSPEVAEQVDALLYYRGFRKSDSNSSYSLPLESVSKGALSKLLKKTDVRMRTLDKVKKYYILEYNQKVKNFSKENYQPIVPEELLPESVLWIEKDEVRGCVLLASCGDGIELRMLSGSGNQMLAFLLAKACENLTKKYAKDTKIYITALVDSADRLVQKLAGDSAVLEHPVIHYKKEL